MTVSEHIQVGTVPTLKVYLPVRQYEVTLKHRLLDQLGGFSQLILEALHSFGSRGYEQVYFMTGMTPLQLEPIIRRLRGLQLVHDGDNVGLTGRGKSLVAFYNHLHRQTRRVWLDGRYSFPYSGPLYYGEPSLAVTAIDAEQALILKNWNKGAWPRADWNEDRAVQQKRLLAQPKECLSSLFKGIDVCRKQTGADIELADWELDVYVVIETATTPFAVEVTLDPAAVLPGAPPDPYNHVSFSSPVIGLRTVYNTPALVPASLAETKPKDSFRVLGLLNKRIDSASLTRHAPPGGAWPEPHGALYEAVLHTLFHNFQEDTTASVHLFNREHQVETWWHPMYVDWDEVDRALYRAGLRKVNTVEKRQ